MIAFDNVSEYRFLEFVFETSRCGGWFEGETLRELQEDFLKGKELPDNYWQYPYSAAVATEKEYGYITSSGRAIVYSKKEGVVRAYGMDESENFLEDLQGWFGGSEGPFPADESQWAAFDMDELVDPPIKIIPRPIEGRDEAVTTWPRIKT